MATEVGVIKGTLAYMSPEQAGGNPDAIDVRTVRVIEEESPRSLRQLRPELARLDVDIETILQKALEKEAERRYGGAADFAGDITRYLNLEAILARHRVPARPIVPTRLLAAA